MLHRKLSRDKATLLRSAFAATVERAGRQVSGNGFPRKEREECNHSAELTGRSVARASGKPARLMRPFCQGLLTRGLCRFLSLCYPRNLVVMVMRNEDDMSPNVYRSSKSVNHGATGEFPSSLAAE